MSDDIDHQLRAAHRRVQKRVAELDAAKADLLAAVRVAVAGGMSLSRIGEAIGCSKSRAQQLVRQADGRGRTR